MLYTVANISTKGRETAKDHISDTHKSYKMNPSIIPKAKKNELDVRHLCDSN